MSKLSDLLGAEAPRWSAASSEGPVGTRDFLGLRAGNLEMLRVLTGSFNNAVVSARQHTILAWAAWRFRQNASTQEHVLPSQLRDFFDLVETIQLVGQITIGAEVGGTQAGLGSDSDRAKLSGPMVPMRFAAYDRTHAASAMAAVQYGPSARHAGLGLLSSARGIAVDTAERGRLLALALDDELRKSAHYHLLEAFPAPEEMSRGAAIDLARHGLVIVGPEHSPRPERAPYARALFNLDGAATGEHRAETMALLLHLVDRLDEGEGVEAHDLRCALLDWDDARNPLPPALVPVARQWRLLELRQVQRYALEAWLAVAEGWMRERPLDVRERVREVAGAVSTSAREATDRFGEGRTWAADRGPWKEMWQRFEPALKREDFGAAAQAAIALTLGTAALLAQYLPECADQARFADAGGALRISLPTFHRWWLRRGRFPLADVLAELVEELVLQQHVAVAVYRYDGERRRLRFSRGDLGWEDLGKTSPVTPALTPDRLVAATALLADLGLLVAVGGASPVRYRRTEAGRRIEEELVARAGS
jgi:hypothetical protein